MGKPYSAEFRGEVLGKIRAGKRVSQVAKEHGINENTIYTWLAREAGRGHGRSETLEMSRLRRENEALLRIIGHLTFEAEREKKNRRRERGQ
jgi:transposase-like protein